jgi:F-type H+-transporting ATPase subunit a
MLTATKSKNILLLLVFLFAFSFSQAASSENKHEEEEEFDATEIIMHHIKDAHEWHILDYTKDGEKIAVSVPLPIILYTNGHLDIFLSSAFHHGEEVVEKGDRKYILYHEKIYLTEDGSIQYDDKGNVKNAKPLDFSITKNVLAMFFASLLMLLAFIPMARKYKKRQIPKGLQSFLEPLIVFIRDDIAIPNIGEKKHQRFMPFLLTLFFFIWFCNLLGLIPFFPGGANVTGNISVTFTLAVFTLIVTNISANKGYWKHIFAFPGVPVWLYPIMIPVELIGIFTKPFALMIRLFANITAGHIIILSLISLIFIFESLTISPVTFAFVLFMNLLELLVATLQAYIFTLLSALFIGIAVEEAH